MPAPSKAGGILAAGLTCPATVEVGDVVEISGDKTVALLSATGSAAIVGKVCQHQDDETECTVETPFTEWRKDRLAGVAALAVGPFVFGAASAVYPYTAAAPALHEGTTTGPVTVTASTDDAFKVKVDGTSYTDTLTAGAGRTFAQIAAEINAVVEGATAVVDAAGNINLVADEIGKTVEIEAVANDCYTLLGWTAAIYYPTNSSHDPAMVAGLVITAGTDAGDAVETLEY